jgi:hypothetical protein
MAYEEPGKFFLSLDIATKGQLVWYHRVGIYILSMLLPCSLWQVVALLEINGICVPQHARKMQIKKTCCIHQYVCVTF